MNALARYFSGAKKTAQNQPWLFGIYLVLRIVVVGVAIRSIFEARYEYALLCILVLVLFAIPDFLERKLQIEIPMSSKESFSFSSSPRKSSEK